MLHDCVVPLVASMLLACGPSPTLGQREVEVHVRGVGVDPLTETPVVVLAEDDGERSLPIWIGPFEARSIAAEMEQVAPPRPNSHDLAKSLLAGLEAQVDRVVVTKLMKGTYFAVLVIRSAGRRIELDARPSDAIAIALRMEAPVFVREGLFDDAGELRSESPSGEEINL